MEYEAVGKASENVLKNNVFNNIQRKMGIILLAMNRTDSALRHNVKKQYMWNPEKGIH